MPNTRKNYRRSKTQKRKNTRRNRRAASRRNKHRGGSLFNMATPAQQHANKLKMKQIANQTRRNEGWTSANAMGLLESGPTKHEEMW